MKTYLQYCAFALVAGAGLAVQAAPSDIVWTDDTANNPVIKSPGVGGDRAYYGSVLFDASANKWRAWFDASSGADIAYAESTDADGIAWGSYALTTGYSTGKQSKASVVQTGPNQFRMWYMADDRAGGYWVNTATSTDGVNWSNDVTVEGIGANDMGVNGPVERFAVTRLADGSFVAFGRIQEPELDPDNAATKILYRYNSTDGVNWTFDGSVGVSEVEGLDGMEFATVVKHPDRPNVWYAWGNPANSTGPFSSFVSTDDGQTFVQDEAIVAAIGAAGTASYNVDRNYQPSATYRGNGRWVMFRSVAEPKTTARATGVENLGTGVADWDLQ